MIKRKLFLIAAIFAVISLAFVSCGDSGDPNDPNNPGGNGPGGNGPGGNGPGGDEDQNPGWPEDKVIEFVVHDDIHFKILIADLEGAKDSQKVEISYEVIKAPPYTYNLLYISPFWSRVHSNSVWNDSIEKIIVSNAETKMGDTGTYTDLTVKFIRDNVALDDVSNVPAMLVSPGIDGSVPDLVPYTKVTKVVVKAAE